MKTSFFKNGSTVYIRYTPQPIGSGFMNQDVERNRFAQGLVTPKIIETEVITDFSKFWECMTNIREKRGYVEIEDTDGSIKKIFPIEMNYNWKDFLLTIKGEEKWK